MAKKIVYTCDLCGKEIEPYFPGGACMIHLGGTGHQYQEWPVNNIVYDVCKSCCTLLWNASEKGLIGPFSLGPFYERAGYRYLSESGAWVYEGLRKADDV